MPTPYFKKGNQAAKGKGSPLFRGIRLLRIQLLKVLNDGDAIERIGSRLIEDAANGDKGAAKLVLSYALGKPDAFHRHIGTDGMENVNQQPTLALVAPVEWQDPPEPKGLA
jgi:hypothetical protein